MRRFREGIWESAFVSLYVKYKVHLFNPLPHYVCFHNLACKVNGLIRSTVPPLHQEGRLAMSHEVLNTDSTIY